VPGETESLVREWLRDVVVIRSLTKHWSIPGIRAGYAVGHRLVVKHLARQQTPWSVSTPAIAAAIACSTRAASCESRERTVTISRWREFLEGGLRGRGIEIVPSEAPFVLARVGRGFHPALRDRGVAVRRCDTFPGLDATWVRIAVRPPSTTIRLLEALDHIRVPQPAH
jgi:cobyrinic acid a,c-diamide synthase